MFKRTSVHYGRMPAPVTPYQKAAQVWDERIGSARVQAKNWRLMAFGCLMLSAGLAGSLVRQSNQGSITPWVVEVDHLGQAQRVAPANIDYQPTDAQIAYHLARFIEDVRGLPIARRSGSEDVLPHILMLPGAIGCLIYFAPGL
ncbi:conjugal transfer protein TrbF, partial [Bradyrhizobium sp. Mp64]|uniref:conjugal transfer protein TrbF n=1 Tax=Bradyrhizobium sp. Mp64 TaxID=3042158 RepID=UPI00248AEDA2